MSDNVQADSSKSKPVANFHSGEARASVWDNGGRRYTVQVKRFLQFKNNHFRVLSSFTPEMLDDVAAVAAMASEYMRDNPLPRPEKSK